MEPLRAKTLLYAIFFSGEGVAIQVPVKKGKSISGKYYKDVVLKKLKKYYQKWHPVTGFKHVRLLLYNAPAHTSAIVTIFLQKDKLTVLTHPPYSLDLAPCDFFLFLKLKTFLTGRRAVQTGAWICHVPVPYQHIKISDTFQKWIH